MLYCTSVVQFKQKAFATSSMTDTKKILIVGNSPIKISNAEYRIQSIEWCKMTLDVNIRDHDFVILLLDDLATLDEKGWEGVEKSVNAYSCMEAILAGSRIVFFGNPIGLKSKCKKSNSKSFLSFTGIEFTWDVQGGDTKSVRAFEYKRIAEGISKWKYSLAGCNRDIAILQTVYSSRYFDDNTGFINVERRDFVVNRYDNPLVFCVRLEGYRKEYQGIPGYFHTRPGFKTSEMLFIPTLDFDLEKSLEIILNDVCSIQLHAEEPEWSKHFTVPEQQALDNALDQNKSAIVKLLDDRKKLEGELSKHRKIISLLYARGHDLEDEVRNALRTLGADVQDPVDANKEDGWLYVTTPSGALSGVLEIKSTKNESFSADDIRQLSEWVARGIQIKELKHKGILIGSNEVNVEPASRSSGFPDNLQKTAKLHEFCLLKVEHVYWAICLHRSNLLNVNDFWNSVFATTGFYEARWLKAEFDKLKLGSVQNTPD